MSKLVARYNREGDAAFEPAPAGPTPHPDGYPRNTIAVVNTRSSGALTTGGNGFQPQDDKVGLRNHGGGRNPLQTATCLRRNLEIEQYLFRVQALNLRLQLWFSRLLTSERA
jgi:hypothetical protein